MPTADEMTLSEQREHSAAIDVATKANRQVCPTTGGAGKRAGLPYRWCGCQDAAGPGRGLSMLSAQASRSFAPTRVASS